MGRRNPGQWSQENRGGQGGGEVSKSKVCENDVKKPVTLYDIIT